MPEIGVAFGGIETVEQLSEAPPQVVDGALVGVPQQGLELGERHLDRVHGGGIGRQVVELSLAPLDRSPDAGNLVGRQIVHDDDVAAAERRGELLLDIAAEGIAVHRAVENHRRGQAAPSQAGDEGHGLPVAERGGGLDALTPRRATVEADHLGVDPGLVEEDQARGVDERLCRPP